MGALSARLQECEARLQLTSEELAVSRRHCAVAEGRIASLKQELEEANRRYCAVWCTVCIVIVCRWRMVCVENFVTVALI